MGGLIFRRKHERDVKFGANIIRAGVGRRHELLRAKCSMRTTRMGLRDIAQVWMRQFVTGRPGGKHPRHGIARLQKLFGMLVQTDVIHDKPDCLREQTRREG